jgi:hypothetical protein
LILTGDPDVMAQWNRVSEWAQLNFEALDEGNYWDGWPRVHRMFQVGMVQWNHVSE